MLAEGGNAIDAAIAAAAALAVVMPYECGTGGDLFALVWRTNEMTPGGARSETVRPLIYNGSGRAPAAASADELRQAVDDRSVPLFGPYSVTVPGAVRGWFDLLERFGSRSFSVVARPASKLAERGFSLTESAVRAIERAGTQCDDNWARTYGRVASDGFLVQPGTARLLNVLAGEGPDAYYRGEIAKSISRSVQRAGGWLSTDDLAEHVGTWDQAVSARVAGRTVWEPPPNSQGLCVLQGLKLLERIAPHQSDEHALSDTMMRVARIVSKERDAHVADPTDMRVSSDELLSEGRLATLEGFFRGLDDRGDDFVPWGGTAYLCCGDAEGLLVGLTQSNYFGFGSGITVPEWGINLHNRGSAFALAPGHPNLLAGRKRPLHTLMTAAIGTASGPTHLLGTMGGLNQLVIQLQLIEGLLMRQLNPGEAVNRARWVLGDADEVLVEAGAALDARLQWKTQGYPVRELGRRSSDVGEAQILRIDGGYHAAADPRSEGSVAYV